MNANHEHELKVAVERIVRPIVARESDKLRMREELYAHTAEAFQHESTAGADEAASVQQAVERLGDPEFVRRELQATVSWISRADCLVDRFLTRPAGAYLLAHAAKTGLLLAGGITLFFLILLSLPYLFFTQKVCNGEVCELIGFVEVWPKLMGAGGRMFPLFAIATFNTIVFADGQREAQGWVRRVRRLAVRGLAVVALLFTQAAAFWLLAGDRSLACFEGIFGWLAFYTLIFASPLTLLTLLDGWRRGRHAEWLDLDLCNPVAE